MFLNLMWVAILAVKCDTPEKIDFIQALCGDPKTTIANSANSTKTSQKISILRPDEKAL